jgi:hypothetical protein
MERVCPVIVVTWQRLSAQPEGVSSVVKHAAGPPCDSLLEDIAMTHGRASV